MALKFGRLTLIPFGILLSLPSCGKKTEENTGFLPPLSQLSKEDALTDAQKETQKVGNSLWAAVLAKLEVPALDISSEDKFIASLGVPSTLITDATKATAMANAKVTEVVTTAAQQSCTVSATNPALVDLTSTIKDGVQTSYSVAISTGGFKIDATTGKPANLGVTPFAASTKIYLMSYKLKDDTDYRYAFLSVPQLPPSAVASSGLAVQADTTSGAYGYPLALYAHAATAGLSYAEIAKVAGDLQLGHIVLAPAFPGEKICISPDATTGACSTDIGKTSVGTSKPYQNDVTDLLGAYECVRGKLTAGAAFAQVSFAGDPVGAVTISNYAKISQEMVTNAGTYGAALAGAAIQPLTYTIGLGRGANVIALAQQRAGAVNAVVTSTSTELATARAAMTSAGIVAPEAFSCSLSAGGNYTYAHGKNKIYLNYWVAGYSDFIPTESLPALELIPAFKEIHATIAAIRDDTAKSEATKATEISDYVKSIDSSYQMASLHGSLANWGKLYRAKIYATAAATYKANNLLTQAAAAANVAGLTLGVAQGAALVMHGTKDKVADISNSLVATAVGAGVTTSIATEKAATPASTSPLAGLGGVNWLGLGINEDGSDNGHVSDTSFLAGKAVPKAATTITSTVDETAYLDKTPTTIISNWLANECMAKSIIADAKTN